MSFQAPISYVELDTLPDAYLEFNVEISFKAESPTGLILYNGQGKKKSENAFGFNVTLFIQWNSERY